MESNPKLITRIVVLALATFPYFLQGAETGGTIRGVITNASGEPVAGAMIKARPADLKMTVAVFSQEQGRYQSPNLPAGHYRMEALGGGYQSGSPSEVEVRVGQSAQSDLVMRINGGPTRARCPPHEHLCRIPPDDSLWLHATH